ncbi:MAG: TonB-dependent receptor [Bacteroidota bacterium]|nr:TonB-dependent receptor [Bacteroidota bacterium]
MPRVLLLCCLFFCGITICVSQSFTVTGKIIDVKDNSGLIGVNILLTNKDDTTQWKGGVTDLEGNFMISDLQKGNYILNISYVSYKTVIRTIVVKDSTDVGTIPMTEESKLLKEVLIQDKQIRAQQLNDTTQYNANSFKTNRDANAEDLLGKMPGVSSENGTVKINGEQVKKIYVDGKEFFGDDPNIALKNLPAEIIDKVQVFDKLSDQAQFTGFDDGNSQKTLNIITKKGKNNGVFGKVYGGYGGPGNRYNAGASINFFKNDRRLTIIGMSNNLNQQNFNSQDLLGITSGSGNARGGGGPSGARGAGSAGRGGGDNSLNNFLVSQQNGIATTHAIGLNYTDLLGKNKKVKLTGSYFFNYTKNTNSNDLTRNYITNADSGLVYKETSNSVTNNFNHRLNLRIEYSIDSFNSIIFTPRLNFQVNRSESDVSANSSSVEGLINQTQNSTTSKLSGYNFANDILYQHKFHKKGRTLSFNFTTSYNNKNGNGSLYSLSDYFLDSNSTLTNQRNNQHTKSYTLSGNISYTEPVAKNGQMQFNYGPSYTKSKTDKTTYDFDSLTNDYTLFSSALSNQFDNTYLTNKVGVSYRYNKEKLNWMVGLNFQHALLQSMQSVPYSLQVKRNFYNALPQAMLNYKFSKEKNIRIMYRSSTNPPSISQLQDVVNNNNPLLLTTGNPDLKQDYSHTLTVRYGQNNITKATNLFAFLFASYTQNYVANGTFIPAGDSLVSGVLLARGSQLTKPVNLSGYTSVRTFLTYGVPINKLKSNFNVNGGFSYTRTPGLINNLANFSNNYALNAGVVLSSNISEKIDFTISYSGNYNIVKNTLQQKSNNNYFNHNASAKFNWQFWKGFVFNTSINNTLYAGISYNTSYWLWNASLAYKFLKAENLEVKFSVADILNQNKNVTRTVTETYIEDARYTALQRYYMGTITYTIRKFGSAEIKTPKDFIGTPQEENKTTPRQSGNKPVPPSSGNTNPPLTPQKDSISLPVVVPQRDTIIIPPAPRDSSNSPTPRQ